MAKNICLEFCGFLGSLQQCKELVKRYKVRFRKKGSKATKTPRGDAYLQVGPYQNYPIWYTPKKPHSTIKTSKLIPSLHLNNCAKTTLPDLTLKARNALYWYPVMAAMLVAHERGEDALGIWQAGPEMTEEVHHCIKEGLPPENMQADRSAEWQVCA